MGKHTKTRRRKIIQGNEAEDEARRSDGRDQQKPNSSIKYCAIGIGLVLALLLGVHFGEVWSESDPSKQQSSQLAVMQLEILGTYPHDENAFTQGLAFDADGVLYESTGLYGRSKVRIVNEKTGHILKEKDLDGHYFGEGAEVIGSRVYQLTWLEKQGFIYDKDSLELVDTFQFSTTRNQGWGLTSDGSVIYVSDGSNTLHVWDLETLEEIRRISVFEPISGKPVNLLNELEWVEGEILANVYGTRAIARIDPKTGHVKGLYDMSNLEYNPSDPEHVLNGIAFHPQTRTLYVTGKQWPYLYQIKLPS